MSLESWKKEFYPVNASEIKSKIEAIKHSILKWRGLQKSNLEKHKLYINDYIIIDNNSNSLFIDDTSCALCNLYLKKSNCENCPLYIYLGHRCDYTTNSPYYRFYMHGNPKPMIKALKETLKKAEKDEL